MKSTKSILIILLSFLTLTLYSQSVKEVTILHWNDFHARNQPYKVSKKDSVTGEQVYYMVGGVGSMSGYLKKYRTANSLVLNADL